MKSRGNWAILLMCFGIVSKAVLFRKGVAELTIKDLAAKTGYAVGTVSRVLNDHPNVSPKARQAILAAVEESGFQLNVNAKQLKQSHRTSILIIVKGTSNALFAQMVEDIQNFLRPTGYPVYVDYMYGGDNEVRRAMALQREKKALGVIFLGGNLENFRADFEKLEIPGVLVTNNAESLHLKGLSSVYIDDRRAARAAVETLISLGHRSFVVVGGHRTHSDISRLRWEGVLDALNARNIPIDGEQDYATVYFSAESGCQGARSLLHRGRSFTALFAMSDLIAVGAIRALRDHGLRVPEDVSVIGFDGLPLGEYLVPRLTTVNQPGQPMAKRAVELLRSMVENHAQPQHEAIPFTLLYRESAGQVRE